MLNLNKDKKYLLACSFGPDSMALFDMLLKEGFNFEVAHVNYHLREESDDEERQLRAFCENHRVKLHIYQNQNQFKSNIEANCRELRYDFFSHLYAEGHFDGLLVAHNKDDLIETYLLQKKRKNLVYWYGLAEINQIKGMKVIRPLLDFRKKDLLAYCNNHSVPYSIDKTNLEPLFERNKIRINIVSKMNEQELSDVMQEITDNNQKVKEILKKISCVSNKIFDLKQLTDIEFAYYLNNQLQQLGIINPITYKQSIEVGKFFKSNKANIALFVANQKAIVYKTYESLIIELNEEKFDPIIVNEPCIIDNRFLYADLVKEGSKRKIRIEDYPLKIRTLQSGDKVRVADYEVLVRRLFIDWKMPLPIRKRWPVFVNKDNKVIYVPRYQKDFSIEKSPYFYVKECFTLK